MLICNIKTGLIQLKFESIDGGITKIWIM